MLGEGGRERGKGKEEWRLVVPVDRGVASGGYNCFSSVGFQFDGPHLGREAVWRGLVQYFGEVFVEVFGPVENGEANFFRFGHG